MSESPDMIKNSFLNNSEIFVDHLIKSATKFGDSTYYFRRRVNWSHRYCESFLCKEISCYIECPDLYLRNQSKCSSTLDDVFNLKVGFGNIIKVSIKVIAHRLFILAGNILFKRIECYNKNTYRKAYVDDIELVYDIDKASVLRAVFPFPLGIGRQYAYIKRLYNEGRPFILDGNPYMFKDYMYFLFKRNFYSLMKLESRAQFKLAQKIRDKNFISVELSDEFDLGSLELTRLLSRYKISVTNSAHGVGKYLPFHCYSTFYILTYKQEKYYHAVRPCRYILRKLNDLYSKTATTYATNSPVGSIINIVWLSQVINVSNSYVVIEQESVVLTLLRNAFEGDAGVRLYYKHHPNNRKKDGIDGFLSLSDLSLVNGQKNTFFASFYSTCFIDPSFKGTKFLIKSRHICPEILFDDEDSIITIEEFINKIQKIQLKKNTNI